MKLFAAILTLVPALLAPVLNAQSNTGAVTGEVTDLHQALIPGAKISIVNSSTNATHAVSTNEHGVYNVSSLQPGRYRITAGKPGFQESVIESIEVQTASTVTADIMLHVGSETTKVSVTSSSSELLTKDSPTLNTTVESKMLEDLPMPDRTALGAVLLAAGVQGDPQYPGGVQSEMGSQFTQNSTPGGSLSISGSRPGTSSILVDGSDTTLASFPRTGVTFSGTTQREITVQQNGLPAQYGRTGGGIINQSTRGGGNEYHGNVSWFHTDPSLQSHQFGSISPPSKHQNMFGMAAGGPLILPSLGANGRNWWSGRDHSFFFVSVEPLRQSDNVFQRGRIPTPDELKGNFNYSLEFLNQGILNAQGTDAAVAARKAQLAQGTGPGVPGIYYQTALNANGFPTGPLLASTRYVPVPNNDLSKQLSQNKAAQQVFSYFPTPSKPTRYVIFDRPDGLPTNDGNNAYLARGVSNSDNRFSIRQDNNFRGTDTLNARYTYVPVSSLRSDLFGPDSPAERIFTDTISSRNIILNETHSFSGNKVNEFRASYTRASQARLPNPASLKADFGAQLGLLPSALGIGFPQISNLAGVTVGTQQNNGPGTTLDVNLGFADDFSITLGSHVLKFGGEMRSLQMNRVDTAGLYGGAYGFTPNRTGAAGQSGTGLATFVLGLTSSFTVRPEAVRFYYRWAYAAGYLQDDYRLTRKLTLNFGLRYNLETPRREKYDRQGSFDPTVTGTLNGLPVQGAFAFSGQNDRGRGLWPTNFMGFEPRIGFAYAPFNNMTLRGSYGLMHTPLTGLGNLITPDLSSPNVTLGGTSGCVNSAAYCDYITNPFLPVSGIVPRKGPLFQFPGTTNLPYVDQSNKVPYVQLYSIALQFQLGQGLVFEAAYSGQKGSHLFSTPLNFNQPTLSNITGAIRAGGAPERHIR